MAVVRPGCEISREGRAAHVARHHHIGAYAAIVLRGGYVEAGDSGRFVTMAGDVLLHDCFDAHQNCFGKNGADILNLPLCATPPAPFGRVADADMLARTAEQDARTAATLLLDRLQPCRSGCDDWPDRLAADIRAEKVTSLAAWAFEHGVSPSSLSRGFRLAYGVPPQRYRSEHRASRAARALRHGHGQLAEVAMSCGFADQPHMTRIVRRLYGLSPGELRMTTAFKTLFP